MTTAPVVTRDSNPENMRSATEIATRRSSLTDRPYEHRLDADENLQENMFRFPSVSNIPILPEPPVEWPR